MANGEEQGGGGFVEQIPWKKAVVAGVAVFVAGLVLQFGLLFADATIADYEDGDDGSSDVEGEPGVLTTMGWWHFSAHYVDLEGETSLQSASLNYIDDVYSWDNPPTFPKFLYRFVPVGLLIAGGYAITRLEMQKSSVEQVSPLIGSSITAGYAVAVVFGTFMFSWSTTVDGTNVSYSIPLGDALIAAGLAYPIVFGSVGGYLAERHLSE